MYESGEGSIFLYFYVNYNFFCIFICLYIKKIDITTYISYYQIYIIELIHTYIHIFTTPNKYQHLHLPTSTYARLTTYRHKSALSSTSAHIHNCQHNKHVHTPTRIYIHLPVNTHTCQHIHTPTSTYTHLSAYTNTCQPIHTGSSIYTHLPAYTHNCQHI